MADSPVRASAQEEEYASMADRVAHYRGQTTGSGMLVEVEEALRRAAAEARGRQQAEQERADFPSQAEEDAAWRKRVQQAEQARDDAEAQCADHQRGENEALNQVSALTQALKDRDAEIVRLHKMIELVSERAEDAD